MKFTKTFDTDSWANIYTSECGTYELYRLRTYKNDGTSKCDGNWAVQKDGQLLTSFPTLKKAKAVVFLDSLNN
jgi:hypothetical protein